jgi:hypothetical protein
VNRHHPILFLTLLLSSLCFAQKKPAVVRGRVIDANEQPLSSVSVVILGQQKGVSTSDSGSFRIYVPADRAFALLFSHSGYKTTQQNFLLNEGEEEQVTIRMEPGAGIMEEVVVRDQRERNETVLIKPNT